MERLQTENRIFKILEYINHPIIPTLKESLELFSLRELLQILNFLETGDLSPIQQFLIEKIQEYKAIIQEIKIKKAFTKLKSHKINEQEERAKDFLEAEDMIKFE